MPRLLRLAEWNRYPCSHHCSVVGDTPMLNLHGVGTLDRLDFDHVCAERGEVLSCGWTSPERSYVEHAGSVQGQDPPCVVVAEAKGSSDPMRRELAHARRWSAREPLGRGPVAELRNGDRGCENPPRGLRLKEATTGEESELHQTGTIENRSRWDPEHCCLLNNLGDFVLLGPGADDAVKLRRMGDPRPRAGRARSVSIRSWRSIMARKSCHCCTVRVVSPTKPSLHRSMLGLHSIGRSPANAARERGHHRRITDEGDGQALPGSIHRPARPCPSDAMRARAARAPAAP